MQDYLAITHTRNPTRVVRHYAGGHPLSKGDQMEEENGLWCPLTKERCWGRDCACAVSAMPHQFSQWSCGLVHLDDYSFAQIIDRDQKEAK